MRKNVLVSGGAGFIGSNLVKMLLENGAEKVTIVDNLLSADESNIPNDSRVEFIEKSVNDSEFLENLKDEFDWIFHLVTFHGNQSSIADPLADHENNTLPTLNLLEKIKSFRRLEKFVYTSAGCSIAEKTFDKAVATEEVEKVSITMDSPYSMSKVFGEFYCSYYFKQHRIPTVRARLQNVYGPGEILGAGRWRGTPATVWRNVTPTFIHKALNKEALPVENGGIATRDFIFVKDLCKGLIACAENGKPGASYNLSTGVETSILELATLINKLAESDTPIALKGARSWDKSGKRFGSTQKSKDELGFVAEYSLEKGLYETIEWFKANKALIADRMSNHDDNIYKYRMLSGSDQLSRLRNKKVVIYGAGKGGERSKYYLEKHLNVSVLCFVDSNPERWGEDLKELKILSPKDALGLDYDILVIASMFHDEIKGQLLNSFNVEEEKIVILPHYIIVGSFFMHEEYTLLKTKSSKALMEEIERK